MTDGETKEDQTTEEPTEEPKEERPIGKLISLPPSELTDEELERVIEFKAEQKALDAKIEAANEALDDKMKEEKAALDASISKMEQSFYDSLSMIDAEWKEASKDDEPEEGGEDGEEL